MDYQHQLRESYSPRRLNVKRRCMSVSVLPRSSKEENSCVPLGTTHMPDMTSWMDLYLSFPHTENSSWGLQGSIERSLLLMMRNMVRSPKLSDVSVYLCFSLGRAQEQPVITSHMNTIPFGHHCRVSLEQYSSVPRRRNIISGYSRNQAYGLGGTLYPEYADEYSTSAPALAQSQQGAHIHRSLATN